MGVERGAERGGRLRRGGSPPLVELQPLPLRLALHHALRLTLRLALRCCGHALHLTAALVTAALVTAALAPAALAPGE